MSLPLTWTDKINSPSLADFIEKYGAQYCLTAEEINEMRDAINEMAVIQQSTFQGDAEPGDTPAGTGNRYWTAVTPGPYTNFGGVVVGANSLAIISVTAAGAFSISQTALDISGKLNVSDIVDGFGSSETNKPGSAKNDRLLDEKKADKTQLNSKADLVVGKNIFDKDAVLANHLMLNDGNAYTDGTFSVSDYMPVIVGQQYTSNFPMWFTCYFDANNNVVAGGSNADITTFTPPSGVAKIKISIQNVNINAFQLEKGSVSTGKENYKFTVPSSQLDLENYVEKLDIPLFITEKADLIVGKNLIDKTTFTLGQYIVMSGDVVSDAGLNSSDFIPVELNQQYTCSNDIRFLVYYDIDKNPLNLGSNSVVTTFTPPSGVAFAKLTFVVANFALDLQLEKGATSTFYQAFKKTVPYSQLQDIELSYIPDIIIPSDIYLTETLQSNIYFDNAIVPQFGDNLDKFRVDIDSTKGSQLNKFWRHSPIESEAGTSSLTLNLKKNRHIIASKTSTLKIASKSSGTGITRKVLTLGDSTIDFSAITTPLKAFFDTDNMDVVFIGTRGATGLKHEGRSGWTINDYSTQASVEGVTNAFWNPTTSLFDFNKYLTDSSQTMAANDWVIIQLGINDMFTQTEIASAEAKAIEMMSQLTAIMNNIQSVVPNIRIAVSLTIPPADNQDGFGVSYGNAYNMELYKKTGNVVWNKKLLSDLDTAGNKTAKRYVLSANCNIDTANNFPKTAVNVNSRSSITELQHINGVHPDVTGYAQMADSYIGVIKWFL